MFNLNPIKSALFGTLTRERSARAAARSKRLSGAVRVAGYVTVLGVVGFACLVHSTKAAAGEAAIELGRDLLPLADLLGKPTVIDLNGEHLTFFSEVTDQPVTAVLDRFEKNCQFDASPAMADTWNQVADLPADKLPPELSPFKENFAQRSGNDQEGSVVCFTRGSLTPLKGSAAWEAFNRTQDIGYLGKARWVYVAKKPSGKTLILSTMTGDSFNIAHIAPSDGSEPPGTDSATVARPSNAKRLLNAKISGAPYGIRLYHSTDSADGLGVFYDADMVKKGWILVPTAPTEDEKKILSPGGLLARTDGLKGAHFYVKDGAQIAIQLHDDGSGTSISIAEMSADATDTNGATQ